MMAHSVVINPVTVVIQMIVNHLVRRESLAGVGDPAAEEVEVVLVTVAVAVAMEIAVEIVMETETIMEVDMVTVVEEETVMQAVLMEILAGDVAVAVAVVVVVDMIATTAVEEEQMGNLDGDVEAAPPDQQVPELLEAGSVRA
jgi:hypothetical protein